MSSVKRSLNKNQLDLTRELGPFFDSLVDHYDELVRTEFFARCLLRHDKTAAEHLPFIQSVQELLLASFRTAEKVRDQYPQTQTHELFAQTTVSLIAKLIESYLVGNKSAC